VPKAMTIQEIADSTSNDAELPSVITAVKTNKWKKSYVSSTLVRKGSNSVFGVDAKQGIHDLQVFSTNLSIPGNYIFSRKSCLVRTMPWCPSCAMSITRI
jgi:hypothetical protein